MSNDDIDNNGDGEYTEKQDLPYLETLYKTPPINGNVYMKQLDGILYQYLIGMKDQISLLQTCSTLYEQNEWVKYRRILLEKKYISPTEEIKTSRINLDNLRKNALSGSSIRESIDFQLLICKYMKGTNEIYMKGRSSKGKSISTIVSGFDHYFYIQRQKPFNTDREAAVFLEKLERWYHLLDSYSIRTPTGSTWKRNVNKKKGIRHIIKWTRLTNRHKTFYGWTPKMYRENVLKVWLNDASYAKSYHEFMESPEFFGFINRDDTCSMCRTFQATIDPALRYRIDHGIIMGGWCKTNRHIFVKEDRKKLYTDYEIKIKHDQLWCDQTRSDSAPLVVLSYDIECAAKQLAGGTTRFPIAYWTGDRLRSCIEGTLNLKVPSTLQSQAKTWSPTRWITYLINRLQKINPQEIRDKYRVNNYQELVPDFKDTDPAVIIVAVIRRYGVDKELTFSKSYALVYEHPDAPPIDRSTIDPGSKIWDYSKIQLRSFKRESAMIKGIFFYLLIFYTSSWRYWCNGNITGFQPVARGSIPR